MRMIFLFARATLYHRCVSGCYFLSTSLCRLCSDGTLSLDRFFATLSLCVRILKHFYCVWQHFVRGRKRIRSQLYLKTLFLSSSLACECLCYFLLAFFCSLAATDANASEEILCKICSIFMFKVAFSVKYAKWKKNHRIDYVVRLMRLLLFSLFAYTLFLFLLFLF